MPDMMQPQMQQQMQQPDPMMGFTQRLESRLNPKIGVPGQDTDPQEQAAFMLKADPQGAVQLAQMIMQAVQRRMMMQEQQRQMRPPQGLPQTPMGGQGGL